MLTKNISQALLIYCFAVKYCRVSYGWKLSQKKKLQRNYSTLIIVGLIIGWIQFWNIEAQAARTWYKRRIGQFRIHQFSRWQQLFTTTNKQKLLQRCWGLLALLFLLFPPMSLPSFTWHRWRLTIMHARLRTSR